LQTLRKNIFKAKKRSNAITMQETYPGSPSILAQRFGEGLVPSISQIIHLDNILFFGVEVVVLIYEANMGPLV